MPFPKSEEHIYENSDSELEASDISDDEESKHNAPKDITECVSSKLEDKIREKKLEGIIRNSIVNFSRSSNKISQNLREVDKQGCKLLRSETLDQAH